MPTLGCPKAGSTADPNSLHPAHPRGPGVVAEVVAEDTHHLRRVVVKQFSSRNDIRRIETAVVFEHAKQHDLTKLFSGF